MSAHNKKRFKNLGKTIAVGLFALLMFTNIKVATMDSAELSDGDLSLFGMEITLFEGTSAYDSASCSDICEYDIKEYCTYIVTVGHCLGELKY